MAREFVKRDHGKTFMIQSSTARSISLCWGLFSRNVFARLSKSTPQPDEKKHFFILSAGKIKSNIMSAFSIMGWSYQAEPLECSCCKKTSAFKSPVNSWQLGLNEMSLLPRSIHITQNAPIMHIMNWEHRQSQDRAKARLQFLTELGRQL